MQTAAFLGSEAYSATDGFVSVTEGQAFANEVVCKVRGSRIAEHDSFTHTGFVDLDAGDHFDESAQSVFDGINRVKERFFVFLVVLVVGKRLSLHQHQKPHQVTDYASGFAAGSFRNVRILFLRHDGGTRRESVGQHDVCEVSVHPVDELFGHTGNVDHDERSAGAELNCEITVADGVQRVLSDAFKSEEFSRVLTVDRISGTGERCSAERRTVYAFAAVSQAFAVALEHFGISQAVVAERDGLSNLHVGVAWHDGVDVLFGNRQQGLLQMREKIHDLVDLIAQVQTNV